MYANVQHIAQGWNDIATAFRDAFLSGYLSWGTVFELNDRIGQPSCSVATVLGRIAHWAMSAMICYSN